MGNFAGTGGTVDLGSGALTVTQGTTGSYAGVITGTGSLTKTGAGTLTLTGANDYTGGTTVSAGTVSISSDANLGNGGTVALGDGTSIDFTAGGTYSHSITVAGDPTFDVATGQTVTQGAVIADGATPGEVEKTGAGTLVLGAANTYTGGTLVSAGTLQLGTGGSLATTGALAVNGGTFDLNGHTQGVGTLSGLGGIVDLGSGTLTVTQGTGASYAGVITGSGSLIKTGAGTLTLSGTNDYTGGTTVSAGHAGRNDRRACRATSSTTPMSPSTRVPMATTAAR